MPFGDPVLGLLSLSFVILYNRAASVFSASYCDATLMGLFSTEFASDLRTFTSIVSYGASNCLRWARSLASPPVPAPPIS